MKGQYLLIIVLLQSTTFIDCNCSMKRYEPLPVCSIKMAQNAQPFYHPNTMENSYQCGRLCAEERFCKFWTINANGNCQIFNYMKDNIVCEKGSVTMKTFYEINEDENWLNIYFIKSGSGITVGPSFLGIGLPSSWGPESCTKNICPDFYRSSVIDIWSELPIKQVKYSLLKENKEVLNLIFNGTQTTVKSWFKMPQVLQSPWKDFYKGAINIGFAIDFNSYRSFYATQSEIGGCNGVKGWLSIFENKTCPCSWDKRPYYPFFVYSTGDVVTIWDSGKDVGVADTLAISVLFQ